MALSDCFSILQKYDLSKSHSHYLCVKYVRWVHQANVSIYDNLSKIIWQMLDTFIPAELPSSASFTQQGFSENPGI